MVAPLKKKNTLEQTSFQLTDNGLIYKGIEYRYTDIIEASRFRQQLEVKTVFVGSDYSHGISILFKMASGENVQLTEQPTWFSNSKEENLDKIEKIFAYVCQVTFENRAMFYVRQVESRGYFEYSGWHFHPSERKLVDYNKRNTYLFNDIELLKSYGFIEIKEKNESFGKKISKQIKGSVGINTIPNTDVFFALLKHYFGIQWK